MEKHLNWSKGVFDSSYQLFEHGQIKHTLFFDTWKNEARGIGQQSSYFFKTNGVFNALTQVFDDKNELIGTIHYHSWQNKATVNLASGELYNWSFMNSWHSQWIITNLNDKQIRYQSDFSSGTIMSNNDDELMLLTGLYIREYYNRFLFLFIFVILIALIWSSNL